MLWRLPLEKVAIMSEIPGLSLGKYRPPGVLQQPCPHGFSRSYPAGAKQEQERRCQLPVRVRLPLRRVFVRRGAVVTDGVSLLQTNKSHSAYWPYCRGHALPPHWLQACNPARNGGVDDHHHRVYHGVVL